MYDPMLDDSPGCGIHYPNSYWADVSGGHSENKPEDDGPLTKDITIDVAIIGAGYTGLSCALHLAREHGVQAHIFEANQTAWGCSGRNAGFILKSSGRKPYTTMQKQWGEEVMRGIYQEMCAGVETVNSLIGEGIDCDQQEAGYIKVAHNPKMFKSLQTQATLQKKMFNYDVQVLSKNELHQNFMADENAYGAIRYQDGFGLNPLKLAWGYQKLARQAGVKVHTSTPVQFAQSKSKHQAGQDIVLTTPQGTVKAKKVVIATNGYTPKGFHPLITNRTLPVLSQIIVTEPLSAEQLAACNFLTSNVVMDTRALKYYYRKLPDNRILFGGRGAITGKSADDPYYAKRLLSVLKTSFPALTALNIDYAWSGWICMALDDLPHIYQGDKGTKDENIFYAMGYCGSGVSFSVQAGKRLAEKVVGKTLPNLPLYNTALPKFPFAPLRRVGQWGYFHYGMIKDNYF
ncbi:FAD-dependent oxidoreductase [Colwellia sp. 1_MG-2023]|uniref:NAD(P)/FAD-dependent oxidoreductase n=1 Tax=unclassified Colwellia TaxID=196834 RepID=UPI001C09A76B|nr:MULTISPECIES: FAD-binding oxidoreductase [unclassified Colwellia]MBU2926141.1 FAD-dependent oxidoreductase [Colwellia sp. C2M11]MDO6652438.1 FAD-dependent oxidoreductase [Colwellia sp. 3_MG-2023]MDO6665687.1 FAD-dependent oxidoreductase [Colwellia sp. 2_MG-2023]MDO6690060.1 FAD-dependent oxidoreductase [Colwellia sp. 1_MG-2023]